MKCPICKGKGEIAEPTGIMEVKEREKIVKDLRKKGYKFHEIMWIVGYKSPQSISKILKKK